MTHLERLSAADTKKYAGQWVAVKDGRVVFASVRADDVVAWVRERRIDPDLVFALPAEGEPANWYL